MTVRPVYSAENAFDAQLVRDRLAEHGIEATVHGLMLTGALGELPADTRPTIWIEDDAEYDRARQIVTEFEQTRPDTGRPWICPHCQEENGPAFETCWHCASTPSSGTTDGHERNTE